MQKFGRKLAILRKQKGWSQRELTTVLGYSSHGFIGNLEAGRRKPSLELITKIKELFDVSFDQLMDDNVEL